MNKPAASSAPLLIRYPEERRAMDVSILLFTLYELCEAFSAATFVFMLNIVILVTPLLFTNYTKTLHALKRHQKKLFKKKALQLNGRL